MHSLHSSAQNIEICGFVATRRSQNPLIRLRNIRLLSTKYGHLLIMRLFEMIRTNEREEGNTMAKAMKKKVVAKKKTKKLVSKKRPAKRAAKRRR